LLFYKQGFVKNQEDNILDNSLTVPGIDDGIYYEI